jgi:hypothetical protein
MHSKKIQCSKGFSNRANTHLPGNFILLSRMYHEPIRYSRDKGKLSRSRVLSDEQVRGLMWKMMGQIARMES